MKRTKQLVGVMAAAGVSLAAVADSPQSAPVVPSGSTFLDQAKLTLRPPHAGSESVSLGAMSMDAAVPANSESADAALPDRHSNQAWQWEIAPFLWAMSLDADVTAKGRTTTVDMSFSDLFDELDFAAMLQVEARSGKFSLQFSGMYAKLNAGKSASYSGDITRDIGVAVTIDRRLLFRNVDRTIGFDVVVDIPDSAMIDVETDVEMVIAELFAGYDLCTHTLENGKSNPFTNEPASLTLTPYAGFRYTDLEVKTTASVTATIGPDTFRGGFEFKDDDDWFDPVIGLEVNLSNLDRWGFMVRGDIGGFGIGDASELVWSVGGGVSYQFNPHFTLYVGYYLLDYDHVSGSGSSSTGLDGSLQGPVLGGAFTF